MLHLLAHSEDLHSESTSNLVHIITEWYVAVPLFFGLIALGVVLLRGKVKTPVLINFVLGVFFLVGVLTFSLVPVLSVIAISLGILGALLIVLSSL